MMDSLRQFTIKKLRGPLKKQLDKDIDNAVGLEYR